MHEILSPDYLEMEEDDMSKDDNKKQKSKSREAFVTIVLHFLKRIKQEELADRLQSSKGISQNI